MIFGFVWLVMSASWFVLWRMKLKHNAENRAFNEEMAGSRFHVPLSMQWTKPDFAIACAYLAVSVGYFAEAVF